jgi:hypothetical protein
MSFQTNWSILFRAKNLTDSRKQPIVSLMKNELWQTKVLVPIMPWKGGAPPQKPSGGTIDTIDTGTQISWENNDPSTVYYAIYRLAGLPDGFLVVCLSAFLSVCFSVCLLICLLFYFTLTSAFGDTI